MIESMEELIESATNDAAYLMFERGKLLDLLAEGAVAAAKKENNACAYLCECGGIPMGIHLGKLIRERKQGP